MTDALTLTVKGLAGGSLVVAFALLGETLSPKRFAGLFSAAPAVAVAGLAVALIVKGPADVHEAAIGMLAGCAAMGAYAAATIPLLRRLPAMAASGAALVVWFAVAGLIAWPTL